MMTLAHQGANRMKLTLLSIAAIAVAAPSLCRGVGFQNGSFELGPTAPQSGALHLFAGSTDITGWQISGGDLAWFRTPTWNSSDGLRHVVLAWYQASTISQTFDTIAGRQYTVDFDLSAEALASNENIKHVVVSAGNDSTTYDYDSAGWTASAPNQRWDSHRFTFTAIASQSTLAFANPTPGSYGPAIDNVRVDAVPVPEPTTVVVLIAGLLGFRKRSRTKGS